MSSARTPMDPPEIAGYTYLDRLGSGGFADVFLYEREFPRQKVAIKVLVRGALAEAGHDRFRAEANAMATVSNHPYIVSIYQADVSPQGHPYLVMEYYPRPNFSVRARGERFAVPSVLRTGVQVAAAVETAHRAGILHRDIKPANILTSEYGRPGLTDFGIASVGDEVGESEGLSIPWSPPEIVISGANGDERADVYSLAATLYTLLTGRSPFEVPGESNRSIDLIARIERSPVQPIERPDVPNSLKRLLVQAMSKDPTQRPSSAMELARALQVIEVEQRFDMTAFEVSDDVDAAPGTPIDPEAGATLVKGPVVIESQTQSTASFRPDGTIGRTAARTPSTTGRSAALPEGLIHETPYTPSATPPPPVTPAAPQPAARYATPAASTYSAPQPAPPTPEVVLPGEPTPVERNRRVVVGAVVLAAALVVTAGVLAWPSSDGDPGPGPDPTATTEVVEPPLPEAVVVEDQGDGVYTVTWDADVEADDSFRITFAGEDPQIVESGSDLEATFVGVAPSDKLCAEVVGMREGVPSEPKTKCVP